VIIGTYDIMPEGESHGMALGGVKFHVPGGGPLIEGV
jgi:hypothetical protein